MNTTNELISRAKQLVNPITLARPDMDAATVGCALLAGNGKVYEGVCISLSCGIGFCAEAAAIANMVKDGETRIQTIVAASRNKILSPCGRCREMMAQVNELNFNADVIMPNGFIVKLQSLLPHHWMIGID